MQQFTSLRITLALVVGMFAFHKAHAGVDWHFPVGLAYGSGLVDVMDQLEPDDTYYDTDTFVFPVGIIFSPYVEFEFGLGVGVTVGPPAFYTILVDYDGWDGYDDDDSFNWIVPLGVDLRYTFLRDRNVSPYVRGGVRWSLAGGDYLDTGDIGYYGGAGIEFLRTKRVAFGFEVGYNSTEVEVERIFAPWDVKDIKPYEITASIFAVF